MDEQVSAEAHRLQQAEMRLAQQESQKMHKTRFLWNEESTKQFLDLMMELRFDYKSLDSTSTGFVPWACYFKSQKRFKEDYSTLKNLSFNMLDQRYKALMTSYRIIRDACEATGGGGLFCQLQRHHMTEEVYDLLKNLNASGIESGSIQTIQNEREMSIIENNGNLQGGDGLIDDTEEIPTNPNGNSPPAVVDETGGKCTKHY
ncbi:hypothetical protein O181_025675 [Austropuccinia psidii MF-1]|uniref:Uncharacterized protein n=1 Tax=Austropuccinia psidii MF-1 TaxID=1389203 RepID=A0A9Q3CMY0_9BASI|nr:hypothetical protein [Austropuccinia psidii MF-1]